MEHSEPNPELYNVPFLTDEFNGMPYRRLGRSGLRVSAIGLGTWKFGYPETGDGARVDEETGLAILDRAVELGVTFWDTANRYNNASGNSERIIGTWFKANPDQRRNVVLATKVFGGMDGFTPNHSRLSRGNIVDSVHACLERLQVDHIDLLYFHRFDEVTPAEESLAAVEDLVRQDTVRYLGASNFTSAQLALYRQIEENASVRCRVVAVQNRYDILRGEAESHRGVLAYASWTGVSFVPYSPLALGLLTGRYLNPKFVGPGDRLYDEGLLDEFTAKATMEKVGKLAQLAHGWDLQLNQLSLAYTLTLPGMGAVIPSSSSLEQLESNAQGGKTSLSEEQRQAIAEVLAG
jgi:1-deoxyxylulose-5-phosphate synthase